MRLGKRHQELSGENRERWLVSYADFMTLLFAFFVVLYATSESNLEKAKEFQESLRRNILGVAGPAGGSLERINEGQQLDSPIEPPIETFAQVSAEIRQAQDLLELLVEESFTEEERSQYFLDLASEREGVRLSLAAQELFEENSDRIRPQAHTIVDRLVEIVLRTHRNVRIESHMSKRANQDQMQAWRLAADRALSFINYSQSRHRIDLSQWSSVSYGDQRPWVPASDPQRDRQNQRLELLIVID